MLTFFCVFVCRPPTKKNLTAGLTIRTANVDSEGYYSVRIGEIIQHRYRVTSVAGKGVFSCVVKAEKLARKNKNTMANEANTTIKGKSSSILFE